MSYAQTRHEEQFNSLTHGLMAGLILAAMPFAALAAWRAGNGTRPAAVAVVVFCLSLTLMFTTSAIYHGLPAATRVKHIFNRLDHIAIYFAIAGTYTPVALTIIGGRAGLTLLLVEWGLVLAGILFKLFFFRKTRAGSILSTAIYLLMGWALIFWMPQFLARAQTGCITLIIAGGICYTLGVVFFALNRRYAHVVWHVFVNLGAACHFLAIVLFGG